MMRSLVLVFLLTASSLFASQERIIQPNQVTVSADAGKPFGDVIVEIKTTKESDNARITGIRLNIDGAWKDVPQKAYADLRSPLLNRVEIRTESGYDDSPWLYIYFEVAHQDKTGKWNPTLVHIAYHKGRFEKLLITTPVSDSEWQNETKDL